MRIIKTGSGIAVAALSLALTTSSFFPASLVSVSQAQESYNHGVRLKRGSVRGSAIASGAGVARRSVNSQIIRDVNNPIFQKSVIFDAIRGDRFGAVRRGGLGGVVLGNRFNGRFKDNRIIKNNEIRLIQTQIEKDRRNAELIRQQELKRLRGSIRRTQPSGRFLTRQEQAAILSGQPIFEDTIPVVGTTDQVFADSACPAKHNCGYRIYSNGTGPRIITPGAGLGKGLPDFDGLRGPKIITLD